MRNTAFVKSILIHIVLALAFLIASPLSARLRVWPEIIVVKTYEMAVEPEPEPEEIIPEAPKPLPKFEAPPEKPMAVDRLRSIPDNKTVQARPSDKVHDRSEKSEIERPEQGEATALRALPAVGAATIATHEEVGRRNSENEGPQHSRIIDQVETPGRYAAEVDAGGQLIFSAARATTAGASDQVGHRGSAEEGVRLASVPGRIGTASEYAASPVVGEQRSLSESGLSRVKLDPYHYQMVSVCLRQCVRSMFTRAGLDKQEQADAREWLKVSRAASSYFEFRFGKRWIRLQVDVGLLGDISSIDFVRVPANCGDAESLLEDATRRLCSLLRYDDCFAKL
jgi:hypothetical protein